MTTRRSLLAGSAAFSLSIPLLGVRSTLAQGATPAASPAAIAPPQDLLPTDWGEVAGQTVSINGIDIYYEVYGEGDPLLLLHGGLANGTYWANQIPAFSRTTRLSSWIAVGMVVLRSMTRPFPTT